jgi:hypothetical protein
MIKTDISCYDIKSIELVFSQKECCKYLEVAQTDSSIVYPIEIKQQNIRILLRKKGIKLFVMKHKLFVMKQRILKDKQ